MRSLALSAALLVASAAMAQTAPAASEPGTIYSNALANGWELWKWDGAETELSVELNGSPRKPIRVEAQGYKGLYLHHAALPMNGYKGLSLLLQAVGGTGQIRVVALRDGKPIPDKVKLVKLAPGGWTKVDVPLSDLGVESGGSIDGLWLQNDGADPTPRFYVTDIALH